MVEPLHGLFQSGDRLGFQHDSALLLFCKGKVLRKHNIAFAERKVVPLSSGIVDVHMAQPISLLQNERLIRAANAVVMTNVKGQTEHVTIQQQFDGLLLKRQKPIAVFNAQPNWSTANGSFTRVAEGADAG